MIRHDVDNVVLILDENGRPVGIELVIDIGITCIADQLLSKLLILGISDAHGRVIAEELLIAGIIEEIVRGSVVLLQLRVAFAQVIIGCKKFVVVNVLPLGYQCFNVVVVGQRPAHIMIDIIKVMIDSCQVEIGSILEVTCGLLFNNRDGGHADGEIKQKSGDRDQERDFDIMPDGM